MNSLDIKTIRRKYSTTYQITGKKDEVENWCTKLKNQFHPAGYGTNCSFIENNTDGTVTYRAYRSNSCD